MCRQGNPRMCNSSWRNRHDGTYLVPHPLMVATGISQQCQRCYPRFQDDGLQAEIMWDALTYLVCFQITVNHIHIAHRQQLTQNPWWRMRVAIAVLEMLDEFFCWFRIFFVDGVLYFSKSSLVGKVNRICQPINVSSHLHWNIHYGTTNGYLNFLYLIEKKHTQLLVEAIEIQHLLESYTIFILMDSFGTFKNGYI